MKSKKKSLMTILVVLAIVTTQLVLSKVSYAATDPSEKLNQAANTIKLVITGLIAVVGVISAAKIVVTYLPSLDDPMEKNKMTKGLTTVLVVTAIGGALTWIVPWAYGLLN